jgi:hypothetical protein
LHSASVVVALAAFCAIASAAPLGSPAFPQAPITLAAAPLFAIPADPRLNGPAVDDPQLLMPGIAVEKTETAEEPGVSVSLVIAGISFWAILAVACVFLIGRLHRLKQRRRGRGRRQPRTMAYI